MADPVRDFGLDEDGDMAVVNGDITKIAGAAAVEQGVKVRIRTFLAEIFLNRLLGVDWINQILIKNPNPDVVRNQVQTAIARTPDVTDVNGANLVNEGNREASIRYKIRTVYSTSPVDGQVVVP